MSNQKEAFLSHEADAWFLRNIEYIQKYDPKNDHVISLIKKYNLKPNSVLEIGCSAGYRLNSLKVLKKVFQIRNFSVLILPQKPKNIVKQIFR